MLDNRQIETVDVDGLERVLACVCDREDTQLAIVGREVNVEDQYWAQELAPFESIVRLRGTFPSTTRIERCANLERLLVAAVGLRDVSAEAIARIPGLTQLNLAGNSIGATGAQAIAHLPGLTQLSLAGNSIGSAGAQAIAQISGLKKLNLTNNSIGATGATAIAQIPELVQLSLGSNSIGAAGAKAIAQIPRLTQLDLTYNSIGPAGAEAIAQIPDLTQLRVGFNSIGDTGAEAIAKIHRLTLLHLELNSIGDVGAEAIGRLKNVEYLDLSGNPISSLLPFLPWLRRGLALSTGFSGPRIRVRDCPLTHPPVEIAEQGTNAILNYFSELEQQGEDHLFEAKVLIVGEGGAGKTSLERRLYQPDLDLPPPEATTRGIDIFRHAFTHSSGRPFRINVWDFGGQEIYASTHRFFLTRRSLYVLVDSTRQDARTATDFQYWLDVIDVLSDESPVLIFQNQSGGRSKTIDQSGIRARFQTVKDFYAGDLREADAADRLREGIEFFVQQLPHIGEPVPAKWIEIREVLQERARATPYISVEEYFSVYGAHLPPDSEKALHLGRYLHDLGVFLHFQDSHRLRDTVILQNEWATGAVFAVLDDELVKSRRGRFTAEDCSRFWSDPTYAGKHLTLLALLEKFELCYKMDGTGDETWLVPQLLELSRPTDALASWPGTGDLVLAYRYEFLPKGVISRLMVRLHPWVDRPDLAWTDGVLFQRGSTEALAEMTSRDEIVLRARGPERKELLSHIAMDLEAIHSSFPGLADKVNVWVPCICPTCSESDSPELYPRQRLLQRRVDKKLLMECPRSYLDVDVLQTLDGIDLGRHEGSSSDPAIDAPSATRWRLISEQPASRPSTGASHEPRRIQIFLASSKELLSDRDRFELYFRRQNDHLTRDGLYLEILRWENFLDSMSPTRLQDEYNRAAARCDVFVCLFRTKVGQYTREEFESAYRTFQDTRKPHIFTFFKKTSVDTETMEIGDLVSLDAFKRHLAALGHFSTSYETDADLIIHIKDRIDRLVREGAM